MAVTAQGRLGTLLAPASVAIVGASANPDRIGSRVLSNLRRHGYPGQVFVINSRYAEVAGLRSYPSLAALGQVPDLALLAVDAEASLTVLTEYAELGGRNAVLLASGFESGADGQRRSERLISLARTYDLNVIGPNAQGVWNTGHKMVLAFGSEAARERVDSGPVAVIAQSGSLGGAVTRRLMDLRVGVSYFISTGDGIVTDTADYLAQVIEDPQVRVAALYLEGARDGRRLGPVLRQASARGVRVVALLGGMSAAGRSATSSHTGRVITRPRLLTHLLEQHGVIVTRTVRDLVAAARILALSPVEFSVPPKIAALGISGGMLALIVDACAGTAGLAEFSADTVGRLKAILPGYTSALNPVDVTGAVVEDEALLVGTVSAALGDPGVEAVIAGLDNRGYDRLLRNADRFISAALAVKKPVVFSLWDPPAGRDTAAEHRLALAAVFIADDPAESVAPLTWLTREPVRPPASLLPLTAFEAVGELRTWPGIGRFADALKAGAPETWLLEAPDPVPGGELTDPPYVVKPVPNAVRHKSDRGLVHLQLRSAAEVASAVRQVRDALEPGAPVLIQRMVTGVEVLVTAGHDPDWGPVLTLGSGGTLVELLDDVVHLAIPCAEPAVRAALARLRVQPLLAGYRGSAPADIDSAVEVVMRLQRILLTHEDTIDEIELNPLVVGAKGGGAYVVDVLVSDRPKQGNP
jgi:acyl-CoA synthetase (NDP forming)